MQFPEKKNVLIKCLYFFRVKLNFVIYQYAYASTINTLTLRKKCEKTDFN